MTEEPNWTEADLIEVWLAANDGIATPKQLAWLNALIVNDEQARQCIASLATQQAWLSWRESAPRPAAPRVSASDERDNPPHAAPPATRSGSSAPQFPAPPLGQESSFPPFLSFLGTWFDSRGAIVLLMIAISLAAVVRSYLVSPRGERGPVAIAEVQPEQLPGHELAPQEFVARITRVSNDFAWSNHVDEFDFLLRLRPYQSVQVASGLLQIDFFSGAKVILQGPAEFTPTGPTTSSLDAGRLTATGVNGNFKLSTPAADVMDLGARFGVSVDAEIGTDLVVFQGAVRATSYPVDTDAVEVLNLAEAAAIRLCADGTIDYELKSDESAFVQSIDCACAADDPTELSLVDIVCGGNGLDSHLSGAIDPETGLAASFDSWPKKWRHIKGTREGFPKSDWSPLIDGVFTPDHLGNSVEIDSLHRQVTLPETGGVFFGPIWARRWDAKFPKSMKTSTMWGPWPKEAVNNCLENSRVGIISLQPNVGITFNLSAIREQQHCSVNSFHASLENFGKGRSQKGPKIDFHVFVDGILKYHCANFTGANGEEDFTVPLSRNDERLTLVSTDGGDGIGRDYLVLVDPVLTLARDRGDP